MEWSFPTYNSLALWLYDYFQTIVEEIEVIWKQPGKWVSWIFLVNRYGFAVYILAQFVTAFPGTSSNET